MDERFTIDGPSFGPDAGGKPDALVVLLHGIGSDGDDLIALAPRWAEALPGAIFVSPHAPFPCDMAPMGRQWFSLAERTPERMQAGIRASRPILDGFLDAQLALHGLADDRLALVGFSQGTMMALFSAPRRARACAGVIGYSGALLAGGELATEATAKPPVLLIHGEADEVVSFGAMGLAEAALAAAGFDVVAHPRPGLGHGIDEVGIALGAEFLARALGAGE